MFVNVPIKKISGLTFGALISILLGYISFISLPDIVVKQIQKRTVLDSSSPVYELWKDAPVDIYNKFYFFNITNPIEIERNGAAPALKEIGPFTYTLKIKKINVTNNDNDTISYKEIKQWYFNRDLSAYDENYVITTINSPLISALNFIQRAPQPMRTWISIMLDTITEGIFIRRSIKQLTFYGYPDILVQIGTLIDPKTPNANGRFAYMAQKNDTSDVVYTVFQGINKPAKLGLVDKVDGNEVINKWKDYPCRSLNDTYTGQIVFSPLEKPKMDIQMYNDLLGRKMNLRYQQTLNTYPGVKAYRYSFDVNNFKNAIDYPPNACYTSRLPKEMFEAQTNGSSSQPSSERSNSAGSILLNLARRRFENGNSPLANLINRNLLARQPLVSVSGPANNSPPTTTTSTTTTTTSTTTNPPAELENSNSNNDGEEEQPVVDDLENSRPVESSRSNLAESLVMTTETNANNNNLLQPTVYSNAHSNPTTSNSVAQPSSTTQPSSTATRENHSGIGRPNEFNIPRDANFFSRPSSESRQDPFSSSLGSLFSNRVRESPLLSLFVPREPSNNNSPDNNNSNRLNGRLFNRNGNNVLGNLISNGLNRLLSLRQSRRMEDISRNDRSNSNNEPTNTDSTSEPNRSSVLSRSVRNALHRRVTRNTGPLPNNSANRSFDNRTTHEEYLTFRKMNMFPSGAFDFSEIAFGAPILLSQPHFLNADPYYNDRLIGLKPDADKHDFFIDVEPITGFSIRTAIRLQINVALLKSPNIFRFRNFRENIFPVFWQEIDVSLPDKFQTMLRMVGAAPNLVSEIALCLFLIIGMVLFTIAIFSFAKARAKSVSDSSNYGHHASPSNNEAIVGALNGQPLDNKLTRASNMAYTTNLNHNNNDTNLSSFNKHKSKESINDEDGDQRHLHRQMREELHGIDNPMPVLP